MVMVMFGNRFIVKELLHAFVKIAFLRMVDYD